jgi:hypothetical protein
MDSAKAKHRRIVLSAVQAREIYKCKLELLRPNTSGPCLKSMVLKLRGQSAPVADCYGVSPKTVRDVWNRRTWAHVTHDMWGHESDKFSSVEVRLSLSMRGIFELIPLGIIHDATRVCASVTASFINIQVHSFSGKHMGRPKGSRDTKPRARQNRRTLLPVMQRQASTPVFFTSALPVDAPSMLKVMDIAAVPSRLALPYDSTAGIKAEQHHDPPYDAANDPFHSDWPHW